MSSTPTSRIAVLETLRERHPAWPVKDDHDPADGDTWTLVYDAAVFAKAWFEQEEHDDIEELVCHFPVNPRAFDYDIAYWHHNTTETDEILKVHLLRLVKGWKHTMPLVQYLNDRNPELKSQLGIEGELKQPRVWKAWNKRLGPDGKRTLRVIANAFVQIARYNNVAVPDKAFQPNPSVNPQEDPDSESKSVRKLTEEETEKVWKRAKPIITKHYWLDRGENKQVPESAFWEAQAFMGARVEMCAEDGLETFFRNSDRERTHAGSTHRFHLHKHDVGSIREMHRETTKELIKLAQQEGKLNRKIPVAIDISKGNPNRCKHNLEGWDSDPAKRKVTEDWILGYKDKDKKGKKAFDYYFQWATLQIVGNTNIPLVLDAIPIKRGMSRGEIVHKLLQPWADVINIEIVLMDREFDKDSVKSACEDNGVYYLNPARMFSSERATCTRLRSQNKAVHIEYKQTVDANDPDRKRIYVPARSHDHWKEQNLEDEADDDSEIGVDGVKDEPAYEVLIQQEFEEMFGESHEGADEDNRDEESPLDDLIGDLSEKEAQRKTRGSKEDKEIYALFETNHPDICRTDDDIERIHMAERFVNRYSDRWGIELGFKQIKKFRVRTTSMDHEYRFFNFSFACTVFNMWRIVDLLVKTAMCKDPERKPFITAEYFLDVAKDYFGLDPPPG